MFSKVKKQLLYLTSYISLTAQKLGKTVARNRHIAYALRQLGFQDYDLPLDQSNDSRFLTLLIGLMSFLAVLACAGTFALNGMTNRWSSGLENKVTIEIAIETKEGHLLSNDTVQRETKKIAKGLKNHPIVKSAQILTHEEIQDLISPWIGDDLALADIPLPGLIALKLHRTDAQSLEKLKKDMLKISKFANLETHHEWLSDLMRFVTTLKTLALFIVLIIGATTIIAITAAIRTRMAIHRKEVELLHAMGATDNYITRQFQRHAMIISLQGGTLGTLAGLIVAALVMLLSTRSGTPLIPAIEISTAGIIMLCAIPLIASAIATLTSRYTVLHSLQKMP